MRDIMGETLTLRAFLELRRKVLAMEINDILRMLGHNPKRCPHCGNELK